MNGLCEGKGESGDVAADVEVGSEVEVDGIVVVRDDREFDACLEREC